MIVTEEMIMDAAECLQIDKQTANNLFKILRMISKPDEVIKTASAKTKAEVYDVMFDTTQNPE